VRQLNALFTGAWREEIYTGTGVFQGELYFWKYLRSVLVFSAEA
jgi:hypothetical protein